MEKSKELLFAISKQGLVQKRQKFEVHYNILEEIGRGAFGTVVKAKHRVTNSIVAIKIIDKVKNYRNLAAIERELKTLCALDHPNIVKLYEWFDDGKKLYLVFEYCAGGELDTALFKYGGVEEKQAAVVFYQLMLALAYMHRQKICHRDIKAGNCLFLLGGPDSPVKLIDFGLAVEYANPKFGPIRLSQTLGTSEYIAPEVLNRNYNEKCDLWSAGVLLYYIVTGTLPFTAPNDLLLYDNIKKGKFSFPTNRKLSEECMSLISGLLKVRPEERLSAAQALDHKWLANCNPPKPSLTPNLDGLARYLRLDRMQKLVVAYIASRTSDSELVQLSSSFLQLNPSHTGVLSHEEFDNWFSTLKASYSGDRVFEEMDINQSKEIEYLDFVAAFLPEHIMSNEGFLTDAFEYFDKDGNGQMCAHDLKKAVGDNFGLSEMNMSGLYRKYDKDKNNALGFSEFAQMMKIAPLSSPVAE